MILLFLSALPIPVTLCGRPIAHILGSSCQADDTPTSQADARPVASIVWSCLGTIFACVWSSVHPNVPHPRASEWQIWRHRAHLVFWGLVAPEIIVLWAFRQWIGARFLMKELEGHNFTMTHGYLAQMGGFMLYKGGDAIGVLSSLDHLKALLGRQQFVYGHYIIQPKTVTFQLPTRVQVEDKCKGDGLSKTLSAAQVWWFGTQCIARWIQGLTVTELELATFAFSVLNGLVYFLWWGKPLKVRIGFPIVWRPQPGDGLPFEQPSFSDSQFNTMSSTDVYGTSSQALNIYSPHNLWAISLSGVRRMLFHDPESEAMQVDLMTTELPSDKAAYAALLAASAAGAVFGAIHCAAWNSVFPSPVDKAAWRICSVIVTTVPLVLHGRYVLAASSEARFIQRETTVFYATSSFVLAYIAARMILLLEAFITLRDLQPGARAKVNWIESFPHI